MEPFGLWKTVSKVTAQLCENIVPSFCGRAAEGSAFTFSAQDAGVQAMAGVTMEVLFVPRRAESLSYIRQAAQSMDINLHVCTDPEEVERLLFRHRYDGLIVDHTETTEGIFRALRQSPSSRGAIAIDVHDGSVNLQSVFGLGANFEMVYPLTVERAQRTLHLAMGLMMLGRRSYYRHPVSVPAQIVVEEKVVEVTLNNVSEQGIGFRTEGMAMQAGPLQLRFVIPGEAARVEMDTSVIWADRTGQAGCRIEALTAGGAEFGLWINSLFQTLIGHPSAAVPTGTGTSSHGIRV
jgi:hypothetical protein